MLSKKAQISGWFILVTIISIGVWLYFKDIRTAFIILIAYILFRIFYNLIKKPKEVYYD